MILVLQIIGIFLASFAFVFIENFFLVLFNFSIFITFFLLVRRRLELNTLLPLIVAISLILDVVLHNRLGTNLLFLFIPSLIFYLLSFISSVEEGFSMYLVTFIASFSYFLSRCLLTSVLLSNVLGFCDGRTILAILLKSLITTLLVWSGELLIEKFRKGGISNQIRLK